MAKRKPKPARPRKKAIEQSPPEPTPLDIYRAGFIALMTEISFYEKILAGLRIKPEHWPIEAVTRANQLLISENQKGV